MTGVRPSYKPDRITYVKRILGRSVPFGLRDTPGTDLVQKEQAVILAKARCWGWEGST